MDAGAYADFVARRAASECSAAADRERRARAALPVVVRLLVERYGARRVTLTGSLASGGLGPASDVDLVVEGLDLLGLIAAADEASAAAGMPVDLVPAERLSPAWRRYHERWGKRLHG